MSDGVTNALPPRALQRVLNPVMKIVLHTPLAHALPSVALLEFRGRRTDRQLSIVAGYHTVDGTDVVFTPAVWSSNFAGGRPVTVWHRGIRQTMTGTLVKDPSQVAIMLSAAIANGASARGLALRMPSGHIITAVDVMAVRRSMVVFSD